MPGVSPAAKQMGRTAAANIVRATAAASRRAPFRYRDYGNLATVGRKAAIVELAVPGLGTLRFGGLGAWLFWLFAHIYFLIGFRNRLMVMVDWAWAYFTYERGARVVAEPASVAGAAAALLDSELRLEQERRHRMDTRTSPARLRIEQHPGRAARGRLRRGRRAVERPAPVGVPARALAGAPVGIGLHRLDGDADRHAPSARRSSPTAATGSRPRAELAGSGIELVRIPTPAAARSTSTGCARTSRAARRSRSTASVIGLAAARQLREALAQCGIALRSDLDVVAAAWPDRPTLPAAQVYEHTRAARRRTRAPASSRRCARRCATPARRTT